MAATAFTTALCSTTLSPLAASTLPAIVPNDGPSTSDITTKPCPHEAIKFPYSHKSRDARCGQSAPLLRKEMERHLRPFGLYRDMDDERPRGVGIYFISHVGGHKYSANVMIYCRHNAFGRGHDSHPGHPQDNSENEAHGPSDFSAAQCIWLT